jgi:2-polyprenyl-3-methyl-5-hydroxy-6-metoxy-1,4-benzoquinol methylase
MHPARSAKALYRRVLHAYYKRASDRIISKIPRTEVRTCWCGGSLQELVNYPQYGVCGLCGCYVNRRPPVPEVLSEFYSLENYWRIRQKLHGLPPIEKRAQLYRADGRIDYWLGLIKKHGFDSGDVIEVGCAPGLLLAELTRKGYRCLGVEADISVAKWVNQATGIEVRHGLFPRIDLPTCDLFLAFDVAEHTAEPVAFWKGIADRMRPEGLAIIQTPIEFCDYSRPFKSRPEFFDGQEHLYLYADSTVRKLAEIAGLRIEALGDAMGGYLSQYCILRKH